LEWLIHFNFSDQDYDAMRSARYQYPEYLSSTDSPVIGLRKLVTQHARGLKKTMEINEETTAERISREMDEELMAATGEETTASG